MKQLVSPVYIKDIHVATWRATEALSIPSKKPLKVNGDIFELLFKKTPPTRPVLNDDRGTEGILPRQLLFKIL